MCGRSVTECCRGIFIVIVRDMRDGSNYIVYHNSNYSNKQIHRINALNYNLFRIKALYKFELFQIRQQLNFPHIC